MSSAQLSLWNPINGYNGQATETYRLYDVGTSVATVRAGISGNAGIYNDLGAGTSFGSATVSDRSENTWINITLNSSGRSDVASAKGRLWAVGGALTTATAGNGTQEVLDHSGPTALYNLNSRRLQLTTDAAR